MAAFPCDIGLHRYGGFQRSAYLTHIDTARPKTYKLRLCERHFQDLARVVRDRLTFLDDDEEQQMSMVCEFDGCIEPRQSSIFAKLYPGGEDFNQWAGDFCVAHAEAALVAMNYGMAKSL